MPSDEVTVTLTRRQAELLSSLLYDVSGQIIYRAMKIHDKNLDNTYRVWNEIADRITDAAGVQVVKISVHIDRLLSVVRHEI